MSSLKSIFVGNLRQLGSSLFSRNSQLTISKLTKRLQPWSRGEKMALCLLLSIELVDIIRVWLAAVALAFDWPTFFDYNLIFREFLMAIGFDKYTFICFGIALFTLFGLHYQLDFAPHMQNWLVLNELAFTNGRNFLQLNPQFVPNLKNAHSKVDEVKRAIKIWTNPNEAKKAKFFTERLKYFPYMAPETRVRVVFLEMKLNFLYALQLIVFCLCSVALLVYFGINQVQQGNYGPLEIVYMEVDLALAIFLYLNAIEQTQPSLNNLFLLTEIWCIQMRSLNLHLQKCVKSLRENKLVTGLSSLRLVEQVHIRTVSSIRQVTPYYVSQFNWVVLACFPLKLYLNAIVFLLPNHPLHNSAVPKVVVALLWIMYIGAKPINELIHDVHRVAKFLTPIQLQLRCGSTIQQTSQKLARPGAILHAKWKLLVFYEATHPRKKELMSLLFFGNVNPKGTFRYFLGYTCYLMTIYQFLSNK